MLLFQVSSLVACVCGCVRACMCAWSVWDTDMGVNLNRAENSLLLAFLSLLGRIPVVLVVKSGRFKKGVLFKFQPAHVSTLGSNVRQVCLFRKH